MFCFVFVLFCYLLFLLLFCCFTFWKEVILTCTPLSPICTKKTKNKQVPFQQKLVSNLHLLLPPPYKTTHNNNRHPLLQQNKLVPCNVLSLYPHNLIVLMKVIVKVMQVTNLHAGTCVTMKCIYIYLLLQPLDHCVRQTTHMLEHCLLTYFFSSLLLPYLFL